MGCCDNNEIPDNVDFNRKRWMASVSDERMMFELSILGTHQSLCHNWFWQNQKMSLKNQLEGGIRAFDFRCKDQKKSSYKKDQCGFSSCKHQYGKTISDKGSAKCPKQRLTLWHEFLPLKQTLACSFSQCIAFIKKNPSEFCIIRLRHECGGSTNSWHCKCEKEVFTAFLRSLNEVPIIKLMGQRSNDGQSNTNEVVANFCKKRVRKARGKIFVFIQNFPVDNLISMDKCFNTQDKYKMCKQIKLDTVKTHQALVRAHWDKGHCIASCDYISESYPNNGWNINKKFISWATRDPIEIKVYPVGLLMADQVKQSEIDAVVELNLSFKSRYRPSQTMIKQKPLFSEATRHTTHKNQNNSKTKSKNVSSNIS